MQQDETRSSDSSTQTHTMDEIQSLEALPDVLNRISENPYDLSLHAEHIRLAQASGMDDQVAAARQMLTAFWPAEGSEEVWLPMIEARIKQGVDTLEDTLEVLGLFQTAEEGYLCMWSSLLSSFLRLTSECKWQP